MKNHRFIVAACIFVGFIFLLGIVKRDEKIVSADFIDCSSVTQIPQTECEALVTLYNETGGVNWINQTNWLANELPCTWYGIECSGNHVFKLDEDNNNLIGVIPEEIGNLTDLTWLLLARNQLSGSIPTELGNLTLLNRIQLNNNQLTGSIPVELGNLTNLSELNLNNNLLSGSIPSELGNMINLSKLALLSNQLLGTIPAELGNLTNLTELFLNENQLSGSIPPEIGNLTQLITLFLSHNQLTGSLPLELMNLSVLSTFHYFYTGICDPADEDMQAWLSSISNRMGNDMTCVDSTNFETSISLSEKLVWCANWPMGDNLTLEVYDSSDVLIYGPVTEQVNQAFFTEEEFPLAIFYYGDDFTMQPDYRIVVNNNVTSHETIVSHLSLTEVDTNLNIVSGTAEPGSDVYIDAWNNGVTRHEIVDVDGNWEAILSDPGDEDFETATLDVELNTPVKIFQLDGNNQTYVTWPVPEIRGTVLLDGTPIVGAEVWVGGTEYHGNYFGWHACTDENGRFAIQKLPPGPSDGFASATGPSTISSCSNPLFLDENGIPLISQIWDHANGIFQPTYFSTGTIEEPYTELQFDILRAYATLDFHSQVHIVDSAGTGACANNDLECDVPLYGTEFRAYDINAPTFIEQWSSDQNSWDIGAIFNETYGFDNYWTSYTDQPFGSGNGQLRYQNAHDELVIAKYIDTENSQEVTARYLLSDSEFADRGDGVRVGPLLNLNLVKVVQADGSYTFYVDPDIDDDGLPDLMDSCPNDETNLCDAEGSVAGVIGPEGGQLSTGNGKINFTVPAGALTEYGTLSITDGGSGFRIETDQQEIQVVAAFFIGPEGLAFNEPVTVTFHWQDDNNDGIIDGTSIDENTLVISKNEVEIGVCTGNPDCDVIANTFFVQVTSLSSFVLGGPLVNQPPLIKDFSVPTAPIKIGRSVNASVLFTDPDENDTHIISWDWGDGSTPTNGTQNSVVHNYIKAGIYHIIVTVTDSQGLFDTETSAEIIIFDPNAGFVNGAGWFYSPTGAFTEDPTLTGGISFIFSSRYFRNGLIPYGMTVLQFNLAQFTFLSNHYDWMIISGKKVILKGTGTINEAGDFGFIISAIDGRPDKMRIKIWNNATGEIVYDNQPGVSIEVDPIMSLKSGTVMITKTK